MDKIGRLVEILDTLLGPEGCPWDRGQTLESIKGDLLEETCEVIDAIDAKSKVDITEELGDVLFCIIFLMRLAEKEGYAHSDEIINGICEKLIRRHPHIFEEKSALSVDEVLNQWHAIKKQEKGEKAHPMKRIPTSLPALAKAREIIHAAKKMGKELPSVEMKGAEMEAASRIFALAEEFDKEGIDAELALRKYINALQPYLLEL